MSQSCPKPRNFDSIVEKCNMDILKLLTDVQSCPMLAGHYYMSDCANDKSQAVIEAGLCTQQTSIPIRAYSQTQPITTLTKPQLSILSLSMFNISLSYKNQVEKEWEQAKPGRRQDMYPQIVSPEEDEEDNTCSDF